MTKNTMKGFTLVELLAVIVILAIILVIAVPQIMKTIDEAREGAFSSSAKLIAASAERMYLENETLGITEEISCSDVVETTSDYSTCTINFTEEGTAVVKLVGAGKFEGKYICGGTRESAVVTYEGCSLVAFTMDLNGGSSDTEYETKYEAGSEVTLTPPTNEDYAFDKWVIVSGEGASVSGNTLIMGTTATSVQATCRVPTAVDVLSALATSSLAEGVTSGLVTGLNGTRYIGGSPNNYVWFNCNDTD